MTNQPSLSEKPQVLDLNVVAAIFGVDPETVRRHIRKGKIYGFQIGNRWKVPTEEVERILTGRPSLLAEEISDEDAIYRALINF